MNPISGNASPRKLIDLGPGDRNPTTRGLLYRCPQEAMPEGLHCELALKRKQGSVRGDHDRHLMAGSSAQRIVIEQVPPTMKMDHIGLADCRLQRVRRTPRQKQLMLVRQLVGEVGETMDFDSMVLLDPSAGAGVCIQSVGGHHPQLIPSKLQSPRQAIRQTRDSPISPGGLKVGNNHRDLQAHSAAG